MLSVVVEWSGIRSFVFVFISSFLVCLSGIGSDVIGSGIGELTAVSSAVLSVSCGNDCGLFGGEAVA